MNKKGQAALEYLMTYGWALIVIAIVVGVLVFIVATPTGGVTCSSSDPTVLNVVSNNLLSAASASGDLQDLIVTNTAGGTLTSVTIAGSQAFADNNATTSLPVGNTTLDVAATSTAATYTSGVYTITYTDAAGLTHTGLTITCRGTNIVISS